VKFRSALPRQTEPARLRTGLVRTNQCITDLISIVKASELADWNKPRWYEGAQITQNTSEVSGSVVVAVVGLTLNCFFFSSSVSVQGVDMFVMCLTGVWSTIHFIESDMVADDKGLR